MEKLLAYDCESGGLQANEHSLLTIYLGIYIQDVNGKHILQRDLDLKIKPNHPSEPYRVTPGALAVNKIDLVKHDREAITINQAAEKLYYFLKEESDAGRNKLIPGGHNEPFDKGFVVHNLLKEDIWRKFVDYHNLDTVSLARGLKKKGKLPKDLKLNLRTLAGFFGHTIADRDLHTARGDTHLYVKTLDSLIDIM